MAAKSQIAKGVLLLKMQQALSKPRKASVALLPPMTAEEHGAAIAKEGKGK